jgi:hypothetical protein
METLANLPEELRNTQNLTEWIKSPITNDFEAQVATDRLGEINLRKKQMDGFRDEFIRPQKRILADFEAKCRDALRPFTEVEVTLRKNLGAYMDSKRQEEIRKAEEQRQKMLAEAKAKQAELDKQAFISGVESPIADLAKAQVQSLQNYDPNSLRQTIRTADTTIAQSLVWEWTVADKSKVPLEYLCVDEKKLNALVKTFKTERQDVSGIVFQQVTRVSVR